MFKINTSENSRSSEYSGEENFRSSEYSGGENSIRQNILMVPKNDRTYSEYFDWSENSDGSEISGSKYSDDGGSTGIRIHIFTLVSISGHRYANDMVKSMLER